MLFAALLALALVILPVVFGVILYLDLRRDSGGWHESMEWLDAMEEERAERERAWYADEEED